MHSSASTPSASPSARTPGPAPDPADTGAGSPGTWSLPEPGSQAEPRAGTTGTASPSTPGDLPQDTVWSARTHVPAAAPELAPEPAPGGLRTGTLVWGVLLVVLGGLLIATAMGTRLNLGVVSIAIVGTIGAFMVLLALIPFPRGPRH